MASTLAQRLVWLDNITSRASIYSQNTDRTKKVWVDRNRNALNTSGLPQPLIEGICNCRSLGGSPRNILGRLARIARLAEFAEDVQVESRTQGGSQALELMSQLERNPGDLSFLNARTPKQTADLSQ